MTSQQIVDACQKRLEEIPTLRERAEKTYKDLALKRRIEYLDKEEVFFRKLGAFLSENEAEIPKRLSVKVKSRDASRAHRLEAYASVDDWRTCCKDEREIDVVQSYIGGEKISNIARRYEVSPNWILQILSKVVRRCYRRGN